VGPLLLLAAVPDWSARVLIPEGTIVFAELGEKVTSDQGDFPIGYQPVGTVWRDVVVGGTTIIEAGTPIVLMISDGTPRGIGARPGTLEIDAMYVSAVGGAEIALRGGYGQVAADSKALNSALGIAIWGAAYTAGSFSPFLALPAALLPGRKAVLEEGIVFDAEIPADTYINISDVAVPTLNLLPPTGLTLTVLTEEISATSTHLPIALQYCGADWTDEIYIEEINDQSVRRIDATVLTVNSRNDCIEARITVELDALSEHFQRGINRFDLTMGDITEEVILNVEI
jgi:hypothetical protein